MMMLTQPIVPQLGHGEVPMPHAPRVGLPNGRDCIPQHYLQYQHTAESLAETIGKIDFDRHTAVFAGSDQGGLYVQVGVVGRENYDRSAGPRAQKLLYGRKWRIEPTTPTSEIVQTAFLAIKKAREHELREHLTLQTATGQSSTPLSSHLDLPLMARNRDWVLDDAPAVSEKSHGVTQLSALLGPVRFGQRKVDVLGVQTRKNGHIWVDLCLGAAPMARQVEGDWAGYDHLEFSITLNRVSQSDLVYEIMDALIRHSDRSVDEQFTYDGFARFSRRNNPLRMAELSVATRPYARGMSDAVFSPVFKHINEQVDAARAPSIGSGALALKNSHILDAIPLLAGHLPHGYQHISENTRNAGHTKTI